MQPDELTELAELAGQAALLAVPADPAQDPPPAAIAVNSSSVSLEGSGLFGRGILIASVL